MPESGIAIARIDGMADPETEHQVSRKVVYESVNSSSTKNSIAAWVIIGVLALGLIVYILTQIT